MKDFLNYILIVILGMLLIGAIDRSDWMRSIRGQYLGLHYEGLQGGAFSLSLLP